MNLTFRQKIAVFRIWMKLPMRYKYSTLKQMYAIRIVVKEWAEHWKALGYQIVTDEEVQRFVRLGKTRELGQSQVELERMAKALVPHDRLIKVRQRHGKAR